MHKRTALVSMILALFAALGFMSAPANAQALNPFVESQYYLGDGNQQLTREQLRADPEHYLRNGAYSALRQHVAQRIGVTSLTDTEFRALLGSDSVRVVPCEGRLYTAGLRVNGTVGWIYRSCYSGEQIVQYRLESGDWVDLFSLGCGNPADMLQRTTVIEQQVTVQQPMVPQLRSYTVTTEAVQGEVFTPSMQPVIIIDDDGCCDC